MNQRHNKLCFRCKKCISALFCLMRDETVVYNQQIEMPNQKLKKEQKVSNGRWRKAEYNRFMKAIEKYGKNWVKIQKMVKTRNMAQIRSHAQKMFLKMSPFDIDALLAPSDNSDSQNGQYFKNPEKIAKHKEKRNKRKVLKLENIKLQECSHEQRYLSHQNENNISQFGNSLGQKRQQFFSEIPHLYTDCQIDSIKEQNYPYRAKIKEKISYQSIFLNFLVENQDYFRHGGNFLSLVQEKIFSQQ